MVIELLSDTTSAADKQKKQIYQTQLQVAEYFWFDPFDLDDWKGFYLTGGVYEEQKPQHGSLPSRALGLNLVHWRGVYKNIDTVWLRWATLAGELLLLSEEAEAQRAEVEAQRAAVAEQRVLTEAEARRTEAQRADLAEQRAKAAEAKLAQLKALLANRP